ncbi:hypothetical protein Tsubulata_047767, partial [Turnera subulata]
MLCRLLLDTQFGFLGPFLVAATIVEFRAPFWLVRAPFRLVTACVELARIMAHVGMVSSSYSLGEKVRLFHMQEIDHSYNMSIHARLEREKKRVETLTQLFANDPMMSANIERGEMFGSLEFIVRVGVGSPPHYQYLVFDTGSDLIWFQCQPCDRCYSQINPIYDPIKSNTYREASCLSTKCQLLNQHSCKNQHCVYKMGYGDRSSSEGVLGFETFIFGNTTFSNVAFGCGYKNKGTFLNFAGILGFGGEDLSFVGQLGEKGRTFSYCLVDPKSTSFGWLHVGEEAITPGAVWSPLVYNPRANSAHYYVDFLGLSVGDIRVPISEQVFQLSNTGKGGVVLDTGTLVTRFPKPAYNAFRDAFIAQTQHIPRVHGVSLFDTCYNITSIQYTMLPKISFHFAGGPILVLMANNILVEVEDSNILCFAFAPSPNDLSIIGSIAQQKIQITIDGQAGRIGFGPQNCASKQI